MRAEGGGGGGGGGGVVEEKVLDTRRRSAIGRWKVEGRVPADCGAK